MNKNICRVCLKTPKTRSRYVTIHEKHENLTLAVLFLQTSGFRIEASEPQIFCNDCRLELIQCFQFIQKCKQTQECLKTVVVAPVNEISEEIKIEEIVTAESLNVKIENDGTDSDDNGNEVTPEESGIDDQNAEFNDDNNDFSDSEPEGLKPIGDDKIFQNQVDPKSKLLALPCDLCTDNKRLYKDRKSLRAHRRFVHKIFRCPFCRKDFDNLKRHKPNCEMDPKNKNFIESKAGYKCGRCSKSTPYFLSREGYQNHLKKLHSLKPTVTCPHCLGLYFPELIHEHEPYCRRNPSKLQRPLSDTRPYKPETRIPCVHCGKMVLEIYLNRHQQRHMKKPPEENERPKFLCDLCPGKSFMTKGSVSKHIRCKHLNHQFKLKLCSICGVGFESKDLLLSHNRRVHTELYPLLECPQCPYKSAYPKVLRDHVKQHLGTVIKNFSCHMCTKKFSTKACLNSHLISHSEKMNFFCDICGSGFKRKSTIVLHKARVHFNEYNFDCPVCSNTYKTSSKMRLHVTRHHPEHQMPPPGTVLTKRPKNKHINPILPNSLSQNS